ncbi:hypothetical protein GCM10023213_47230 [Prosthecobacter algae]|uniref:Transposase n=1 Tax=Prosthecobacter algae TaxID=1144682 RepID=A0ABP9PRH9_9BACT
MWRLANFCGKHAPALLESVVARRVGMDKAYDGDALRELMESQGMKTCISPRTHRVENFFEKIKRMRRIATRYDKTDVSFMAFVLLGICTLSPRNQS